MAALGWLLALSGVCASVGAARAQGRARELRRLLMADLNSDFTLGPRERLVAIASAWATMFGRICGWFSASDRDGDGKIS
ncbi:MAG: hypothetical protein HKN30_01455 [Sulfitobacter sp.]|nr:hypothetical protein [Sulfitobacter sp.]